MDRVSPCLVSHGPYHILPCIIKILYTHRVFPSVFMVVLFSLVEEFGLFLFCSVHAILLSLFYTELFTYFRNQRILFHPYSLLSFPSPHRSLFYCVNGHLYLNVFLQNVHC